MQKKQVSYDADLLFWAWEMVARTIIVSARAVGIYGFTLVSMRR